MSPFQMESLSGKTQAQIFHSWAPLIIELYEVLIASYFLIHLKLSSYCIRTQFDKNMPFDDNRITINFITNLVPVNIQYTIKNSTSPFSFLTFDGLVNIFFEYCQDHS
jgi:hypothetical protein